MTLPRRILTLCCALIFAGGGVAAQELRITPNNRTIYVTANEEVAVEPDIAVINFGYQAFGPDQQAAMNDLSQKSKQITKAMLEAAIDPKAIETSTLEVERTTYFDPQTTAEARRLRNFTARENWRVRVKAADASILTGIARSGGANSFQGVSWELADPNQAYAKANAAALIRARAIAEQMANDMGAKLGKIIYLSNSNPVLVPTARGGGERVMAKKIGSGAASPAELQFDVSRQLIHRGATVYAVFAIE
jgi:uncharacterized protein YggE